MKKGMMFLIVGIFMLGVVSATICSSSDQTIMKLYQENNSHGALWNDVNYVWDICYDGTAMARTVCTGANSFLWLSDTYNAHASLTQTIDYATGVCYGDLSCHNETITVAGDNCSDGSVPILSLYSGTNSHMAAGNYDGYDTKICCGAVAPPSVLYWADANGLALNGKEPNIGDTVRAVKTSASSGIFDVWEYYLVNSNFLNLNGENIGGNLVGKWSINETTLNGIGNGFDFQVDGTGDFSDKLFVNKTYSNSPTEVTIISPPCGSDYNKNDVVTIEINADDEDDVINGNVSINGVVVPEGAFENGLSSFNYTFSLAGNYQIMAEAIVSRSNGSTNRAKHISNIMIINVPYVNGEKYVAACIDYPKNYDDIPDSLVNFSAESTRAVEIVGGAKNVILPGSARFSWYWRFIAPNSQVDDVIREFVNSTSPLAYRFNVQFPVAGDNSAMLQVNFD